MKFLLLLALCVGANNGYMLYLDAKAEECFYEELKPNQKAGLSFEVAEGGFLDVDVSLTDPSGSVIYAANQETEGRFRFSASMQGNYVFCFSNAMSTVTPKVLKFKMIVVQPREADSSDMSDEDKKIKGMIGDLRNQLREVKEEQDYMEIRDTAHGEINRNTNRRVVIWACFEFSLLLCMTIGQIYYIKRFFEVRRVI
ncbi:transmembrane emp24 domain-containing protein 2-like [Bolinopsis microptera]|uniref:transmembrane emp24 domain-containing protein 2-like n=1 Tax=Bolinopsis microptera TaxID=2820187 RepID=UPI0030799BFA